MHGFSTMQLAPRHRFIPAQRAVVQPHKASSILLCFFMALLLRHWNLLGCAQADVAWRSAYVIFRELCLEENTYCKFEILFWAGTDNSNYKIWDSKRERLISVTFGSGGEHSFQPCNLGLCGNICLTLKIGLCTGNKYVEP